MNVLRSMVALALVGAAGMLPCSIYAQGQSETDARAAVQAVVNNELKMDASDHSRWMYLDRNKEYGKETLKLVIQTPEGDLSKTIEINGRPLTSQQEQADRQKMNRFVTDPSVRQQQKKNDRQDDKSAAELTKMLPDAFLWTEASRNGDETTYAFKPNPKFNPPTREGRVFSAMEGTMVVNTKDQRIQSLQGKMIRNVTFGWWGVLGKLEKGGTFHVARTNVGGHTWNITQTHVHIQGHALLFKSIGAEQDEETSHYKPAPESISLEQAANMLNDGTVAKEIGVEMPKD